MHRYLSSVLAIAVLVLLTANTTAAQELGGKNTITALAGPMNFDLSGRVPHSAFPFARHGRSHRTLPSRRVCCSPVRNFRTETVRRS